jgi:hypothetical protein
MVDQILTPGTHTAKFTWTPPAAYVGLALNAQLYLSTSPTGATLDVPGAVQQFTAVSGANNFSFSLTVPATVLQYHAFIIIDDGTQLLSGYSDLTDNVIIGNGGTFGPISIT